MSLLFELVMAINPRVYPVSTSWHSNLSIYGITRICAHIRVTQTRSVDSAGYYYEIVIMP